MVVGFDAELNRKLAVLYDIYRSIPVLDIVPVSEELSPLNTREAHDAVVGHLIGLVVNMNVREDYLLSYLINLVRKGHFDLFNDALRFSTTSASEWDCVMLGASVESTIKAEDTEHAENICKSLIRQFFAAKLDPEKGYHMPEFKKDAEFEAIRRPHLW